MKTIHYPDLPIVAYKDEIIEALHQHALIVVAGETGSGKTTQLPKICLEAGLGETRKIAHTQPRRIAARSMAFRIASELQVKLGELVGYKIRFSDQTSDATRIQLMTDGILLSETQHDRLLSQYDCIIIDEAHERSLNIDFLLGYIKNLLKKRQDLKVIVTSATIDVEKFSEFFNSAPLIKIPGRSYPIEVNYLTEEQFDTEDPAERIAKTVELACQRGPGDILIFQSGEKEIHELSDVLHSLHFSKMHILPLYARQSAKEQQKIFEHYSGRKIIIATNVAETSLTVPNIKYVIDPGFARVSRYNYRNKLQRLPIEAISQASAEQRKGRCGRVGPGICYRLYDEADFKQRALYTDPEILRVNLAGVILRMLELGFRPIETFPLIDKLDPRYIKDGMGLLERLGAIDSNRKITQMGRQLAKIPVEPKFARMLMGGVQYGCLKELLIIVSALSIIDPRERAEGNREKSDEIHAKFQHEQSDFMFYLNLWDFLFSHKKTLSHQKFRLLCRQNYLSYLRVCEWFDVHEQLEEIMTSFSFKINMVPSDYSSIHRAILTGIIDGVGLKDEKKQYLGARNINFYLHPASILFKQSPQWIVSCEIVHTTKTYGRINAKIEPEWIEEVAEHLLKRQYLAPHYEQKEGRVVAFEKLTLFGLPILDRRRISYEKINLKESREIFIKEALCDEKLIDEFAFFEKNRQTISSLRTIEDRMRKQGALVNIDAIERFYSDHLPQEVASARALKIWLKEHSGSSLIFSAKMIVNDYDLKEVDKDFPTKMVWHETVYEIEYLLDLSSDFDGATLIIPIEILKNVKENDFSWPIPGWVEDKIDFAISQLPKKYRILIGKIPRVIEHEGTFSQSLCKMIKNITGLEIEAKLVDSIQYPPYLCTHFKVVNENKEELAKGQSLIELYEQLKHPYRSAFATTHEWEKKNITEWNFNDLPHQVEVKRGEHRFTSYPALMDCQDHVEIRLCETEKIALYYHCDGLTRLALFYLLDAIKYFNKEVQKQKKVIQKLYAPFGTVEEFCQDILFLSAEENMTQVDPNCRSESLFLRTIESKRATFLKSAKDYYQELMKVLELFSSIQQSLYRLDKVKQNEELTKEIDKQLKQLFPSRFIIHTPRPWLFRLYIYLKAIEMRLEKFSTRQARDKLMAKDIQTVETAYLKKLSSLDVRYRVRRDPLFLFRFSLEELRVSLFAESLKTIETVSMPRLLKQLANLR